VFGSITFPKQPVKPKIYHSSLQAVTNPGYLMPVP
jgi:hypothetical protein